MELDTGAMLAAAGAMVRVFLTSVVGVVIASVPIGGEILMTPTAMKLFSRMSNYLFLPFLIIYSSGSSMNTNLLGKGVILIFFSAFGNTLSSLVAMLCEQLHGSSVEEKQFAKVIRLAVGTPNQLSLPIMVLQSMCTNSLINADYDDDRETCTNEAMTMLLLYTVGFMPVFWGYSFPLLSSLRNVEDDDDNDDNNDKGDGDGYKHNVDVEQVQEQVQKQVSGGSITSFDSSSKIFPSSPELYLDNTEENKLVGSPPPSAEKGKKRSFCQMYFGFVPDWLKILLTKAFLNISMVAQYIGIALAMIPGVQKALFGERSSTRFFGDTISVIGQPLVAINCLVMSGSLTLIKGGISSMLPLNRTIRPFFGYFMKKVTKEELALEAKEESIPAPVPFMSICIHCGLRLIVMPIIILVLEELAVSIGVIDVNDRLLRLIICVEAGAPSAQIMLVSLNQLGLQIEAGKLAYMYLPHYVFSVITITIVTTVATQLIYNTGN